jgi:hypothetical protein
MMPSVKYVWERKTNAATYSACLQWCDAIFIYPRWSKFYLLAQSLNRQKFSFPCGSYAIFFYLKGNSSSSTSSAKGCGLCAGVSHGSEAASWGASFSWSFLLSNAFFVT